jgi:hypothetical protein
VKHAAGPVGEIRAAQENLISVSPSLDVSAVPGSIGTMPDLNTARAQTSLREEARS